VNSIQHCLRNKYIRKDKLEEDRTLIVKGVGPQITSKHLAKKAKKFAKVEKVTMRGRGEVVWERWAYTYVVKVNAR
jgi:tyrosine-protein phosphatase YwqE